MKMSSCSERPQCSDRYIVRGKDRTLKSPLQYVQGATILYMNVEDSIENLKIDISCVKRLRCLRINKATTPCVLFRNTSRTFFLDTHFYFIFDQNTRTNLISR